MDLETTLASLIKEEEDRTANANEAFGSYDDLAKRALTILNTFVASIEKDHFLAAALLFSIEKTAALAYLSYVRGHIAQGEMNARQVIEFSALLTYILAHPDVDVTTGEKSERSGFVRPKVLSSKAYKWLDRELAHHSKLLAEFKGMINDSMAHGNVYLTHFTFEYESGGEDRDQFRGSFFDNVDDDVLRLYLASFARLILVVVETVRLVAEKYGGFALHPETVKWLLHLEHSTERHRLALGKRMGMKEAD